MVHLPRLAVFKTALQGTDPDQATFTETYKFDALSQTPLGALYLVLQVYSHKARKENARLASSIAAYIKNEYRKNPRARAKTALAMALRKTNAHLARLQSSWREQGLQVHLAAAACQHNHVYVASLNKGILFLVRDTKLLPIIKESDSFTSESRRTFSDIVTLPLAPGDQVVLTTPQIYRIQSALAKLKDHSALSQFIASHRNELAHLGIIHLSYMQDSVETPVGPEKEKRPSRWSDLWRRSSVRVGGAIAALMIVAGLSIAGLFALNDQIRDRQTRHALLQELSDSEQQIQRLIGLSNVTEAEHALARMHAALSELEKYQGDEREAIQRFSAAIVALEKALSQIKDTAD